MEDEIGRLVQVIEADQGRLSGSLRASEAQVRASAGRMEQSFAKALKFEKLGQLTRQAGALALAVGTSQTTDSAFDQNIAKAEQLVLTMGAFAGPKGQLISLGFVAIAEGVRFLNRQFSDPSAKEYEQRLEKIRQEEAARRKTITDRISALQEEVDTFGMSAAAIEEYRLAKAGATRGDIQIAQSLIERRELLQKEKTAQEEAARATEERARREADAYARMVEEDRKLSEQRTESVMKFLQQVNAVNQPVIGRRAAIAGFGSSEAIRAVRESADATTQERKLDKMIRLLTSIDDSLDNAPAVTTNVQLEEARF